MPRALLISFFYPPSNAAGAQRWLNFTSYGMSKEWTFDVVAGQPELGRIVEASNSSTVIRVPNSEHWFSKLHFALARTYARDGHTTPPTKPRPSSGGTPSAIEQQVVAKGAVRYDLSLRSLRRAVYAYEHQAAFLPWASRAEAAAKSMIEGRHYDVVISSGPPHAAALVARRIAKKLQVPFIADLRDPWAEMDIVSEAAASPLYFSLARWFEGKSVAHADTVVMNTELAAQAMRANYPDRHIVTVRNGFNGAVVSPRHEPTVFKIIYTGEIYLDRDPRPLMEATKLVIDRHQINPANFRLVFIGRVSEYGGIPLTRLAEEAGVREFVDIVEQKPKTELHAEMATAAVLISLPQSARLSIPSKLYEYLHFPAWVVALEPSGTATEHLLRNSDAQIVEPSNVRGLADALSKRYEAYVRGERPVPLAQGDIYSMQRQAKNFFEILETCITAKKVGGNVLK